MILPLPHKGHIVCPGSSVWLLLAPDKLVMEQNQEALWPPCPVIKLWFGAKMYVCTTASVMTGNCLTNWTRLNRITELQGPLRFYGLIISCFQGRLRLQKLKDLHKIIKTVT